MQREVLQVVETAQSVYFMTIVYEEGDIGSAKGNVYSFSGERRPGNVPTQVLATNDSLRVMWVSPSGALWIASADGNVGTTAVVSWPTPAGRPVDYAPMGGSPAWSVTSLPRVRATGLPPNVTALWGTADDDVLAGTYGGHIYHWDGASWKQVHDGPDNGEETVRAFGGLSRSDVFAVAAGATILHFDGGRWLRMPLPGASNGSEVFTAVSALPGGDVLISGVGSQGRLLHGTAAGLSEFGRYPLQLMDMATIGDQVLFATADGAAERFGRDVRMIKPNFRPASICRGIGRLFFIEAAQEAPRYIEFDPSKSDAPWWRFSF